ncbi:MAG: hypothetical protein MRERC_1c184 [Mycoplasmataceae bacterium RC_NB112A]|nr:MAG: hypothetical protein MRERC_1c184 [Mycoplasmataceae bacterium RC_NB112A]
MIFFLHHFGREKKINLKALSGFQSKNAQEYVDKFWKLEERKKEVVLNIFNESLEGKLELKGFTNLKRLNCRGNKIDSLDVSYCPNLTELDCYCNKLTKLNLNSNSELSWLDCSDNKLTEINGLTKLAKLRTIYCSNNKLTSIVEELKQLANPEELTKLDIHGNNVPRQDLFFLKPFINLEFLWLGGYGKRHEFFYGSLEPLKKMSKLRVLRIGNTDIDSGLEYLSSNLNLQELSCQPRIPDAKVAKISEELKPYMSENHWKINIKAWKETQPLKN